MKLLNNWGSAMKGKVYLVGSGPGSEGLLTQRARNVIDAADVVLFDQLPGEEILASLPARAEKIDCGKYGGKHTLEQDEIEALVVDRAKEGKTVVRLKGGDPFLFGRGGEEAEVLAQAGIPFEVVPGVSSFHAVPCYAGVPLTQREHNSIVTIVTGHDDPLSPVNKLDWCQLARTTGTLVVLMGLRNIRQIAATLVACGRPPDTPVVIVSRGTTRRQISITGTLNTIAKQLDEASLPAPAVTVIGEAVRLRGKLNWFEHSASTMASAAPRPAFK